jgi:hypothetical protein
MPRDIMENNGKENQTKIFSSFFFNLKEIFLSEKMIRKLEKVFMMNFLSLLTEFRVFSSYYAWPITQLDKGMVKN